MFDTGKAVSLSGVSSPTPRATSPAFFTTSLQHVAGLRNAHSYIYQACISNASSPPFPRPCWVIAACSPSKREIFYHAGFLRAPRSPTKNGFSWFSCDYDCFSECLSTIIDIEDHQLLLYIVDGKHKNNHIYRIRVFSTVRGYLLLVTVSPVDVSVLRPRRLEFRRSRCFPLPALVLERRREDYRGWELEAGHARV